MIFLAINFRLAVNMLQLIFDLRFKKAQEHNNYRFPTPHNGPKRRKAGQNLNVFMIFCENMYIGVFEVADYESKFKLKKKQDGGPKNSKKNWFKI
jgi:hypothetical protein